MHSRFGEGGLWHASPEQVSELDVPRSLEGIFGPDYYSNKNIPLAWCHSEGQHATHVGVCGLA